MPISVITGVAGQDGSYLAEYLVKVGHTVVGIARRVSSSDSYRNLSSVISNDNFLLLKGDVTDHSFIYKVISKYKPDYWYNLAAQSNVGHSFCEPFTVIDTNNKAVASQLKIINDVSKKTKFYQASTTEIFGGGVCPANGYCEDSKIYPISPYAISKLSSYWHVINHRKSYGLYACNGIAGNHSSIRRGHDFAIRKITSGVAKVKLGIKNKVRMGDLSSFRDEGHAEDYVEAMYLIMQQDEPSDYIISTGFGATIEDMFRYTCKIADVSFEDVYEVDPQYMRPSDVPRLLGNPNKLTLKTGWRPKQTWKEIIDEMYQNDILNLKKTL